ncbi:RNA polymerase sigma70 factor [Kitasatospora cheerisanensis KCTC 2395]|uniref:RNA polymerase sigma70 factor n=1 Tax=Kitasatospora cheerisanensis KCTC 2395 TaxID=1348663 RepID=A0A066Z2X9_9ACTN|nr:RNA polymerase sigma70 factor [Kitasatospora cheerisanensis KCTC 2395]
MIMDRDEVAEQLEPFRRELTAYCYRMLGSAFEAEDAVQETMVRAWSKFDGFEGRAALRTWLYRIATNVCLDMGPAAQRRARPMDLTSPCPAGSPDLTQLEENIWVGPVPDARVLSGIRRRWRWAGSPSGWRSCRRCRSCRPVSGRC